MSQLYSVGTQRRLVVGPADARRRLCLPVTQELYEAVLEMSPEEEQRFSTVAKYALGHALEEWRTLTEIKETTTGTPEETPHGISDHAVLDPDVPQHVSDVHGPQQSPPGVP